MSKIIIIRINVTSELVQNEIERNYHPNWPQDELPGHMYWKCIRLACVGEHREDNPGDVKSRLVYHCVLFHNFRKIMTLLHPNFIIKFESLMKWKNFKNISILEMHSYFKSFKKHQKLILKKIQNTCNGIIGEGVINKNLGIKTIFSHSSHSW